MKNLIMQEVESAIKAVKALRQESAIEFIDETSTMIANAYKNKN